MEYCELGDLSTCITADSPCSENDAKIITSQILEGLDVMHGYGFTHRDLKPQVCPSIIVDESNDSDHR
jgi:serine/threonine protein kinase